MYPRGPFARQNPDMKGPFTVARRDLTLAPPGYSEIVLIPVGSQLPDRQLLGLTERQIKDMFALAYLEQEQGTPFKMPPTDAEREKARVAAARAAQQRGVSGASGRR